MWYLIFFLGLVFSFNLLYIFKNLKKPIEPIGEVILEWYTKNNSSIYIKAFILLLSTVFFFPLFVTVEYNQSRIFNLKSLMQNIDTIGINFKPIQEIHTYLFVLILYFMILFFIVNFPIKYTISEKGISYSLIGFNMISFYKWDSVLYYQFENKKLLIWFSPPEYKHDWEIPITYKNSKFLKGYFKNKVKGYNEKYNGSNRKEDVNEKDN